MDVLTTFASPSPTNRYPFTDFIGILLTLGLLLPVASMVSYITREKELRQKELMKMMSVNESDIGWSWYISFIAFHFITATFSSLVSGALYSRSDGFLLWIFWLLTWNSITVFCMFCASITSKAIRAVLISLLVFFAGPFIAGNVSFEDSDTGMLGLISIHPVAAFSYGLQVIGQLEDAGVGLNSDTIDTTDNPSGYTFSDTLQNLIGSSVILGLFTWYLNRVIRPDYGQALPLWFPFSPSYWCSGTTAAGSDAAADDDNMDEAAAEQDVPVEPVGDVLRRQAEEGRNIEIKGLRKQFGDKMAVDGLTLSMYSGEITALLGHNGTFTLPTYIFVCAGDSTASLCDISTSNSWLMCLFVCLSFCPCPSYHEHTCVFFRCR